MLTHRVWNINTQSSHVCEVSILSSQCMLSLGVLQCIYPLPLLLTLNLSFLLMKITIDTTGVNYGQQGFGFGE